MVMQLNLKIKTKLPLDLGKMHFIGVGGIGMSGIAEIIYNLGYKVSGSDLKSSHIVNRLIKMGIDVKIGHSTENINKAEIVVISSAVDSENIELKEARRKKIPVIRRSEILAELMRLKSNIAVAGTHGKTTTTSMVAAVLDSGMFDPTVVNGGIIQDYGSNARLGEGDWMIVEADESDGTIVKIPSTISIITNLDPEHLDHYGTFTALKKAFLKFLNSIPFYGVAICFIDHPEVKKLTKKIKDRKVLTYGYSGEADFQIKNLEYRENKAFFNIYRKNNEENFNFELPMYGDHNVANAAAAITVALYLHIPIKNIKKGLKNFKGVKRRFTKVCNWNGIDIIDDYAHHPVEILAVLSAARKYTAGRVIAIHQPHRYSRLESLMSDFSKCFDEADIVGITPIYEAGEKPIKGINSEKLIKLLTKRSINASIIRDEVELVEFLKQNAKPGDIFICLGAGSISQWVNKLPYTLNNINSDD